MSNIRANEARGHRGPIRQQDAALLCRFLENVWFRLQNACETCDKNQGKPRERSQVPPGPGWQRSLELAARVGGICETYAGLVEDI